MAGRGSIDYKDRGAEHPQRLDTFGSAAASLSIGVRAAPDPISSFLSVFFVDEFRAPIFLEASFYLFSVVVHYDGRRRHFVPCQPRFCDAGGVEGATPILA